MDYDKRIERERTYFYTGLTNVMIKIFIFIFIFIFGINYFYGVDMFLLGKSLFNIFIKVVFISFLLDSLSFNINCLTENKRIKELNKRFKLE